MKYALSSLFVVKMFALLLRSIIIGQCRMLSGNDINDEMFAICRPEGNPLSTI